MSILNVCWLPTSDGIDGSIAQWILKDPRRTYVCFPLTKIFKVGMLSGGLSERPVSETVRMTLSI